MASGSTLVPPMVLINMGGEMVNILHQRLDAQNVEKEKGTVVLQDVIGAMFSPKFIDELFKPQNMYSEKATKQIFHELAHSSIMRLNGSSMDKLYDLITMGFKYQALSCAQPQQLLQVTLNHLEVLKIMVPTPSTCDLIDSVIETTVAAYRHLDVHGWIQLKQCLLDFFQGRRIKVSLFLQQRVQATTGTLELDAGGMLPVGAEMPGIIRYFGQKGKESGDHGSERSVKAVTLPMASADNVCGSLTTYIDFDSPMGTNLYAKTPNGALDPGARGFRTPATEAASVAVMDAARWKPTVGRRRNASRAEAAESKSEGIKAATAGLNLLASLMGASDKEVGYHHHHDDVRHHHDGDAKCGGDGARGRGRARGDRIPFMFNLFPDDRMDCTQAKDGDQVDTIIIDLASEHRGCAKMLRELDLEDDDDYADDDGGGNNSTSPRSVPGVRSESKGAERGKERTSTIDVRGGGKSRVSAGTAKGAAEDRSGQGEIRDGEDLMDDLLDLMDAAESK